MIDRAVDRDGDIKKFISIFTLWWLLKFKVTVLNHYTHLYGSLLSADWNEPTVHEEASHDHNDLLSC